MPPKAKKITPAKPTRKEGARRPPADEVESVIASLKRLASKKTRDGMARYGIPSDKAIGVPVGKIQELGKRLRKEHDPAARHALSEKLWQTDVYEARMLTSFVDDPALVTPGQMDRWCREFDSWAICDTLCFHLFDRTPHAFGKVAKWCDKRDEFVKRAAFALLACLALHDKIAGDELFLECLPVIERAAADERNFVKKGVSWALRGIGRRNAALNDAAVGVARRLAESPQSAARWVGKDALRDITRPAVLRKLAVRRRDA